VGDGFDREATETLVGEELDRRLQHALPCARASWDRDVRRWPSRCVLRIGGLVAVLRG
jgi:hypothetical protein